MPGRMGTPAATISEEFRLITSMVTSPMPTNRPHPLAHVNGANILDEKVAGFFGPRTFFDSNVVGINTHHEGVSAIQRDEKRDHRPEDSGCQPNSGKVVGNGARSGLLWRLRRASGMPRVRLASVAGFMFGSYPRAAVGSFGG